MFKVSKMLVRQKGAIALSENILFNYTPIICNQPVDDEYLINFTVNHTSQNISVVTKHLNFNEQSTILAQQIKLYKTRYPCYDVHEFHS